MQSVATVTLQNTEATVAKARDSDRVTAAVAGIIASVREGADSVRDVAPVVDAVAGSAERLTGSAAELDRIVDELTGMVAAFEVVRAVVRTVLDGGVPEPALAHAGV